MHKAPDQLGPPGPRGPSGSTEPRGPLERTDEELAAFAQQESGEAASAAFGELVQRFEGPLFGFLFVRVGNAATAEELVQEAFLRAWRKLKLYDPRQRFGSWLYTMARNLAVSRARVQLPGTVPDEVLVHLADESDPTQRAAQNEELDGIWALAHATLSREACSALWLRYHEELSNAEIGRILERPAVTIRVMLFRAREALTQALEASPRPKVRPASSVLGTGT